MPHGLVRSARLACHTSVFSSPLSILLQLKELCRIGSASRGAGVLAMLLAVATLTGAQTATVGGN